jgi:hypothetical protein
MSFTTKDIKIKKSARPSGRGTERAASGQAIKAELGGKDRGQIVQKIKVTICYVTLKNLTAAATNFCEFW